MKEVLDTDKQFAQSFLHDATLSIKEDEIGLKYGISLFHYSIKK
jgi:hypothetical protein